MKTSRLGNIKCGYSTRHSMYVGVVTILAVSALFILYLPPSFADEGPIVEWQFPGGYSFGNGAVGFPGNIFEITDPAANLKPDIVDIITATVSSIDTDGNIRDSIEITLSEESPFEPGVPDSNSGVFRNKNVIFSNADLDGEKEYSLDNTITFAVDDSDNFFGADPDFYGLTSEDTIDTINSAFFLSSSSDPETFSSTFPITETGQDTQIYTGTLRFSTEASDLDSGTILVQPGDILSIFNTISDNSDFQNSLIIPNPDPRVGALRAAIGDSIIITYGGIECDPFDVDLLCNTEIGPGAGGGAGGGGPVLPSLSLVIDVLAGVLPGVLPGGGGEDRSPPSLVFSSPSIFGSLFAPDPFKPIQPTTNPTAPVRINNNGYFPTGYASTIKPEQVSTGQNVALTLSFLEASSVQHVALHFVDENSDELSDTDPTITFDNGKVIKSDPDGMLGDQITFTKSRDGSRSIFNFGFSFDQPTNRHLMITVWDDMRNSANVKIFDAFNVSGQPVPQEENHLVLEDLGQYIITQDGVTDIEAQSNMVQQEQAAWFYSNSIGRLDRHDMTSFYSAVDNEQARAGTIIDSLNLDTKTFVATDVTKPYDTSKRAPELTWSNVGHKLRDSTKTPDENTELLKQLCWQEHLKATKISSKLYHTGHWID